MNNEQINEQLNTVRTIEDIRSLLSILYTNINNQSKQFYDMFENPAPLELKLEKYDENGDVDIVEHPNVAKMRVSTFIGEGSPEGVIKADVGSFFIDVSAGNFYYKISSEDQNDGWILAWNVGNLRAGKEFLSPDGIGTKLKKLDASKFDRGVLSVPYGGTGVSYLSGLVKGNGVVPFSEAVVDVDYVAPSSFAGLIMACPTEEIPEGWLVCDGTEYSIIDRPELKRLFNKLKNKYGGDGISTFSVPNLIGRYIKYGVENVGNFGSAHIGVHNHGLTQAIAASNGAHTHSTNSTGAHVHGSFGENSSTTPFNGWYSKANKYAGNNGGGDYDNTLWNSTKDGNHSHTALSAGAHTHAISGVCDNAGSGTNDVSNFIMAPIIKY